MGFLDQGKEPLEKGKKLAQEHSEQTNQVIERAGDLVDQRTGKKHTDKVDQAQERARQFLTGGNQPGAQQANPTANDVTVNDTVDEHGRRVPRAPEGR